MAVSPGTLPVEGVAAWGPVAFGVAAVAADVGAARMSAPAITWRRRIGFVAIVAALWRGGPFSPAPFAVPIVLWSGFVWVALVLGGRALSRAIASATGEDQPT